jgi:hypothetical protein
MSEAHDSHAWKHGRSFDSAECKDCGLKCGRASGGGGWGPGDWKYYDKRGEYTGLYRCPNPWPRNKPRPGNVRFKCGDLDYEMSVAEAKRLRDRIDAALKRSVERG